MLHGERERGNRKRRWRVFSSRSGRTQAVRYARGADRGAVRSFSHGDVRDLLSRLQPHDQVRKYDQLSGQGPETIQRRGGGDDRTELAAGVTCNRAAGPRDTRLSSDWEPKICNLHFHSLCVLERKVEVEELKPRGQIELQLHVYEMRMYLLMFT